MNQKGLTDTLVENVSNNIVEEQGVGDKIDYTNQKIDELDVQKDKDKVEDKEITKEKEAEEKKKKKKEENIRSAQIYFISKVGEYFKNKDYSLQNNRTNSIRNTFREIIELNQEMIQTTNDKERLKISMRYLLEGLLFHLKNNPLYQHPTLKRDINYLILKIDKNFNNNKSKNNDNNKENIGKKEGKNKGKENESQNSEKIKFDESIFNSITSLEKRFKSIDILELHIELIKNQEDSLVYKQVDDLLNSFVSELIFEGYSLKYLDQWYIKEIQNKLFNLKTKKEIEDTLDIFNTIQKNETKFTLVFSLTLPSEVYRDIIDRKEIAIGNTYTYIQDIDQEFNNIQENLRKNINSESNVEKIMENFRQYFPKSSRPNHLFMTADIKAPDIYKGVELISQPIENYLQIYKVLNNSSNIGFGPRVLYLEKDKIWEMLDTSKINSNVFQKNFSKREKEDIHDFILFREELRLKGINSDEVFALERAFSLINNLSSNISLENRFLNLWSALEYIVIPFQKNSIIEKVRQVVPKVICLYLIKDKMNILWDNLISLKAPKDLRMMLEPCMTNEQTKNKIKKYDKQKFANLLKNKENAVKLHEMVDSFVLKRQISELNGFLNNQIELKQAMELNNNIINHDLNSIYRVRNKLVHSGKNIPPNMEIITGKLFRYVSCLMGTLIHYLKRSPYLTVGEVLHSIVDTYDWHLQEDLDNLSINEYITPPYLFL